MSLYVLLVYLHLIAGIALTGYALFWVVMAYALRSRAPDLNADATLAAVGRAGWPPFVVPPPMRLPLRALGWLLVAVMLGTGLWLASIRGGFGLVADLKLGVLAAYAVVLAWFSLRPAPSLALTGLLLLPAALGVSAYLR